MSSPPVVRLAQIGHGFMTAGYISDLLHQYAVIPEPDLFFTVRDACADAVIAFSEQVGPHLFAKSPATRLTGRHDAFGYVMPRACKDDLRCGALMPGPPWKIPAHTGIVPSWLLPAPRHHCRPRTRGDRPPCFGQRRTYP